MNRLVRIALVIFVMLPFLNIYYLENQAGINMFWEISPLYFVLIFYIRAKKDLFVALFTIFIVLIVVLSLLSGYVNLYIAFYFIGLFSLMLFINYYLKVDYKSFFIATYILFSILILINAASIMIGGLGIYARTGATEYLLGRENNVIRIVFPGMVLIYLYTRLINRNIFLKLFSIFNIIVGAISVLYLGSSTSLVIIPLFLLIIIFSERFVPSFGKMFIAYVALSIFLIWGFSNKFFADFVTNVLGNDITFSGRTYIWDYVKQLISENLFTGIGYGNNFVRDNFYPVSEEHNMILQLLMNAGLMGLVIFLIIIFYVNKELKITNDSSYDFKIMSKVISFGVIAFLLIGLMESRLYDVGLWLLIVIAFNIKAICEEIKLQNNFLKYSKYRN